MHYPGGSFVKKASETEVGRKNLWEMKASLKFSGKFSYHLSYLKWNGVKNNSTPILPLIFFGYRLQFIAKSIRWIPKCGWNLLSLRTTSLCRSQGEKQFLTFRTSVKCSLNENGPRPLSPRAVGFTLPSCAWATGLRFVVNGTLVISVHSFRIPSWEGESIFGTWRVVSDVLGHSEGRLLSYTCLLSLYRPGTLFYFFFSPLSSSSSCSVLLNSALSPDPDICCPARDQTPGPWLWVVFLNLMQLPLLTDRGLDRASYICHYIS